MRCLAVYLSGRPVSFMLSQTPSRRNHREDIHPHPRPKLPLQNFPLKTYNGHESSYQSPIAGTSILLIKVFPLPGSSSVCSTVHNDCHPLRFCSVYRKFFFDYQCRDTTNLWTEGVSL